MHRISFSVSDNKRTKQERNYALYLVQITSFWEYYVTLQPSLLVPVFLAKALWSSSTIAVAAIEAVSGTKVSFQST